MIKPRPIHEYERASEALREKHDDLTSSVCADMIDELLSICDEYEKELDRMEEIAAIYEDVVNSTRADLLRAVKEVARL